MVDEYDKTGWESPWHHASQQLHALKKMLACPSTEQEPRNFLFLSPLKQISNLVSYSLPLRDEDWEINRVKSPDIYFHYLGSTALEKAFPTTFLEVQELQKLVLKLDFPLGSSTFLGTFPSCCQEYKKNEFFSELQKSRRTESERLFSRLQHIPMFRPCCHTLITPEWQSFSQNFFSKSNMLWMFQQN